MSHLTQTQEHDALLKMLAEELLVMPDSEILDGDDPNTLRQENMIMVAKAKAIAGRRRLAASRATYEANKNTLRQAPEVSLTVARAAIEAAINDDRYTLAARSLGEMSGEDILRLYHQMEQLKTMQDKPDGNR